MVNDFQYLDARLNDINNLKNRRAKAWTAFQKLKESGTSMLISNWKSSSSMRQFSVFFSLCYRNICDWCSPPEKTKCFPDRVLKDHFEHQERGSCEKWIYLQRNKHKTANAESHKNSTILSWTVRKEKQGRPHPPVLPLCTSTRTMQERATEDNLPGAHCQVNLRCRVWQSCVVQSLESPLSFLRQGLRLSWPRVIWGIMSLTLSWNYRSKT